MTTETTPDTATVRRLRVDELLTYARELEQAVEAEREGRANDAALMGRMLARVSELETRSSELVTENDALRWDLEQLKAHVASLEEICAAREAAVVEAQSETERQQRRIEPLRTEVDELMSRLDEVLREKNALEECLRLGGTPTTDDRSAHESEAMPTNPPAARPAGLDRREVQLARQVVDMLAQIEADAAARREEGLAELRTLLSNDRPATMEPPAPLRAPRVDAHEPGARASHVGERAPATLGHSADRFEFSGPLVLETDSARDMPRADDARSTSFSREVGGPAPNPSIELEYDEVPDVLK